MIIIDKNIYYYIILFATFLLSFSLIPFVFEILQQKLTSNIPYLTLIPILLFFLILLFISINRLYYIHIFLYLIGVLCISIILFLKREYDTNNTIIKEYNNLYSEEYDILYDKE